MLESLEQFRGEYLASGCVVLELHTATFDGQGQEGHDEANPPENTDPPANAGSPANADSPANVDSPENAGSPVHADSNHHGVPSHDKLKISYEKYRTISRAITMHLREQEAGLSRDDIVDWYLSATGVPNPADLVDEAKVVRSVLKNMWKRDKSVVEASDVGEDGVPKYIVNPNIIMEQ